MRKKYPLSVRGTLAGLIVIAAAFYVLNVLTCLFTDDFSYRYTFAVTTGKYRISNLYELFLSQRNHYRVMNGRTVAHVLAQLFLMWGKPVFNVINTAAFTSLGVLIYRHGQGAGSPLRPARLFSVFAALWFITPNFGESFLWLVGSCNYMYGVLIILLALIPVTNVLDGGSTAMAGWKTPLYFILCVLAGWTNENTSVALAAIFMCCILWLAVTKRKIPVWLWAGLIGSAAGCLLLLLSPGQAVRLANSEGIGGVRTWIRRGISITASLEDYLGIELAVTAVLFAVGMRRKRPVKGLVKPGIFFMAGLASTYSMILSPGFPTRAWSGPVVFFTAALVAVWQWADPEPPKMDRRAAIAVSAIAIFAVAGTYVWAVRDLSNTRAQFMEREADIAQVKAEGGTELGVTPIYGHTRWNCYNENGEGLSEDASQWPNTAYCLYYELERVYIEHP